MTKIKVNHIYFVLDKSGSMHKVRKLTVDNFNEQVQQLKEDQTPDQLDLVSLITFSGKIRDVRDNIPINQFEEIKLEEYSPLGSTALYDAVARAITKADMAFERYPDCDNAALITILTDGDENSSKEFDNAAILELINEKKATERFTFAFMGCGEIVKKSARKMGIPLANTASWDYNPSSVEYVFNKHLEATKNYKAYRAAGMTCSSNFYDADTILNTETSGTA